MSWGQLLPPTVDLGIVALGYHLGTTGRIHDVIGRGPGGVIDSGLAPDARVHAITRQDLKSYPSQELSSGIQLKARTIMSFPSPFHSVEESVKSISSSPSRPSQENNSLPAYRTIKRLPFELREHCLIYFEEGLYTQALSFLVSLLTPGNTISRTPALLPPPQHLALACTLIVHPTFTTRAKSEDRIEAANLALRYLRLVLKLVGPVNGNLQDAFVFSGHGNSSRRGTAGRRRTDEIEAPKDDEFNINSDLAGPGALWSQVEDFWQVVGWAFNCSILYERRWERWSLWLEYMIQVLEKDWETRWVEFESDSDGDSDPRAASMIVKYLSTESLATGRERKVLRAIFADGTSRSAAEFSEVWKNETRERKKAPGDVRRPAFKVAIEEGNYGDYDASESSDFEESSPTSPPSPVSSPPEEVPDVAAPLGGIQSISLRLRLLSLLSTVSAMLPERFLPLVALHDLYLEHIRPLPLPTFFLLMSPASLTLVTAAAASTLTQYILRSLIASAAPLPTTDALTQDVLEQSYLPFAANTQSVGDNARVSLCIETLLRLLDKHVGLEWSESLAEATEKGIEARERKAKKEGKKGRTSGPHNGERMWLTASAERIRGVVELSKLSSSAMHIKA